MDAIRSVLFVCTANQCRSPMAEGLLRALVECDEEMGEWRIGSAGTWAYDGFPAMPMSQEVMLERGIDISEHRSRPVDRELISAYDLVLTMERVHKEALQQEFSEYGDRVCLISEMVGSVFDVQDPVAGTISDYRRTADLLEDIIRNGQDSIGELALGGCSR